MRLKILIFALIFLGFCFLAQKTFAQAESNTFSSSYIFSENLSTQVTFREEFVNSSATNIIDKYRVIIPYSDAENIQTSVNGQNMPADVKSYETYREATVDLPDISSGQNVKVITTFKTSRAANDFGRMKIITLAAIDPKVTMRGQTLIIPDSFGKISSISDDCEISYTAATNVTCNSGGKIYLTAGERFYFNFDLKQSLKNSSGKNAITNFLLPFDGLNQDLYFYETSSAITAKKDDTDNLYLETKLLKNTQKEIEVNGILGGGNKFELNSQKALTEETDIWNFSSNEVEEVFSRLNGGNSAEQIYSYIIQNYKPGVSQKVTRTKVSEFSKTQELTNIRYSDLAVTLLRKAGIRSVVVIGKNNGDSLLSGEKGLSSWILYFDSEESVWKGMDPYFADSVLSGDYIFLNPDRIIYFVIDGFEDDQLFDDLTSVNGLYVDIYSYELDEVLLEKPLNYSAKIIAPEKVSLNVDAEISLGLTNESPRLIHFDKIYRDSTEISIRDGDRNVWVLPSQSFAYQLKGIVLTGLLKAVSAKLDLVYTVASSNESQNGTISSEISAIPTFKTFLPYVFVFGVISIFGSGYFLFKSIRKRLKRAKN